MMLVLLGGFSEIQSFLNADSLGTWLLLTPTALFLTAVVTILRYYANRKKGYKILSRLSIAQALVGITFTISLGWYGWQAKGLITANLLTLTFGSAYLLYFYRIDLRATDWFWSRNHWSLAQHYKDFPLYNASTSFLDGITSVLPVFFLTKYFPEAVVGYYALLTRVATGPLSFISQAVTQVHLQRVAELVHQGGKELPTYIYKLTLLLSFIVLIPTVIIMTYAPELFIFLFGSTWRTAGEILVILMPAFGLRFVVSTISGVFSVTGHIKLAAYWKILAFLAMMGALLIVSPYATINVFFVTLLLLDFFLYLILFIAIIYAVNKIRPNFLH